MTLSRSHDFVKPTNALAFDIQQWGENQVSMIGHYNRNAEIESFVMSKYAGIENDIPRPSGKLVAILGNKSDEMRFVIALIMRQISPIKAHELIVAEINPPQKIGKRLFLPTDPFWE